MIIATRNRLIHGYLGIDDDTLWSIIQDDIPKLLEELKKLESWWKQGWTELQFEVDPNSWTESFIL